MEGIRWRLWVIASVFLLATLYMVPNFATIPWWPVKTKLTYGLDIQGGIYLVMGVDTDGVMRDETRKMADSINKSAKDKGYNATATARNLKTPGAMEIDIVAASPDDGTKLKDFVNQFYGTGIMWLKEEGANLEMKLSDLSLRQTKKSALDQSIEVIRNRIDQFGVSEPSISAQGENRILIQLPGLQDAQKAKELINKTAKLEFHIVDDQDKVDVAAKILEVEKEKNLDFKKMKYADYVDQLNIGLKGKIPEGTMVLFGKNDNATSMEVGKVTYLIKAEAPVTGDMLRDARPDFDEFGTPRVAFHFKPEGAGRFGDLTEANKGKRLAVVLDNIIYTAPVIQSKITDNGVITLGSGNHDQMLDEAKTISMALRAGALPAALEQLEERTVGPTLGKDSIDKAKRAALIGSLFVIAFIFLFYGTAGLYADIAVIFNVFLIVAFLTAFGATLTLPGIAAIALTVGMAVDANIIIFERIREEVRAGASYRGALSEGFKKALLAIVDANIVASFTAMILFYYGTGPVRGFAVSMLVGILTTMFTAVFFTRTIMMIFESEKTFKEQDA